MRKDEALAFEPRRDCALVRQGLSGPGICAYGDTRAEAIENLQTAKMLA